MNTSLLQSAYKSAKKLSLVAMLAIGLNGCGSGGSSDEVVQVAPNTLEGVTFTLFDSFRFTFFRLAGEDGNESGAADYDVINQTFEIGEIDGTATLSNTVEVPVILSDVRYTFVKTSADTARLTITFENEQVYPYPFATPNNRIVFGREIFWGGPDRSQTSITADILFADGGSGRITNSTTRFRSVVSYFSSFTGTATGGSATFGTSFEDFDTVNSDFDLGGAPLQSDYTVFSDPGSSNEPPSGAVWEDLQGRSIDFVGGNGPDRVAQQSTVGGLLEVPGASGVDDSGTMLVESSVDGVTGGSGDYGYIRTGGANATFSIEYDVVVGGVPSTKRVDYFLTFDSINGGTFVTGDGATGTFLEEVDRDF